jgi:hypothetical protein
MKNFTTFAAAAIMTVVLSGTAFAATFTKATVKKIDEKAGKVTLIHEELVDLEMPAMTMVFVLGDPALNQVPALDADAQGRREHRRPTFDWSAYSPSTPCGRSRRGQNGAAG